MAPFSTYTTPQEVPEHLKPFIATQDPLLYTPIDHASWRFIMRLNQAFFAKHAHQKYLDGLEETGISTERIPLIPEMDAKLRKFGWRAVPVSGFIPPSVFLEFQALGILPIAAEMRTLDHLAYTPAPDIVHEAAGHAPIIADPEYAAYLKAYGEVSRRAIFSDKDVDVYEAIRRLSDVKEDPASTSDDIAAAQRALDAAVAGVHYVSEATQLARMSWWTIEYGLVGTFDEPKIYGAGLLSSVGESYACLKDEVLKIPMSLDSINTSYDITRPQPQLFLTPSFPALRKVLEDFAELMAFRRGGTEGLGKAKMARTVTTIQFDSGIQISGVLSEFLTDAEGNATYLKFRGPSQLSHGDFQLDGHGPGYHLEGFGTPVGTIRGKSPAEFTRADWEHHGFKAGVLGKLRFDSGVTVEGVLKGTVERGGRTLVASFERCTVRHGDRVLFDPAWGTFDMACGQSIPTVFGGAGDRTAYAREAGGVRPSPIRPKTNLTDENRELNPLYARLRQIREEPIDSRETLLAMKEVHDRLEKDFPKDWLLRWELLELGALRGIEIPWQKVLRERLAEIAKTREDIGTLIRRGLELLA